MPAWKLARGRGSALAMGMVALLYYPFANDVFATTPRWAFREVLTTHETRRAR